MTALTNLLPGYTFGGDDAYEAVPQIVAPRGRKICIIGGETALAKAMPTLRPILEKAGLEILGEIVYGKECTFGNGKKIAEMPAAQEADVLFAVGGGKAIDTVKLVSHYTGSKPFFSFPTVAGTCAATSKVAAVYHEDHTLECVFYNDYPTTHCFINSRILVEAPERFIWAGMGDTIAKHYECEFSSRGRTISYEAQLGVAMSIMCAEPILTHGVAAMAAAKAKKRNDAFDQMTLAVIFTTGLTSNFLIEELNSNLAHAVCYGLGTQKVVEENCLHGQLVAYGVLVLLTADKQLDERDKWITVYKKIGLPVKLADIGLSQADMEPVYAKALAVPDTEVSPFTVTQEIIEAAVNDLEAL